MNHCKHIVLLSILLLLIGLPGTASAIEYKYKIPAKNIDFYWTLETDRIHIKLSGKTTSWVGIGFDPEKAMSGANIIIGAVKKGKFRVEDHYADRKTGHASDEKLGGESNVLNPSGEEVDGVTTITFTLLLELNDKYDKSISPNGFTRIMLATGTGKDSFKTRHPFRSIYEVNLSTGENRKIK